MLGAPGPGLQTFWPSADAAWLGPRGTCEAGWGPILIPIGIQVELLVRTQASTVLTPQIQKAVPYPILQHLHRATVFCLGYVVSVHYLQPLQPFSPSTGGGHMVV